MGNSIRRESYMNFLGVLRKREGWLQNEIAAEPHHPERLVASARVDRCRGILVSNEQ